jgi:hypothetical protein
MFSYRKAFPKGSANRWEQGLTALALVDDHRKVERSYVVGQYTELRERRYGLSLTTTLVYKRLNGFKLDLTLTAILSHERSSGSGCTYSSPETISLQTDNPCGLEFVATCDDVLPIQRRPGVLQLDPS